MRIHTASPNPKRVEAGRRNRSKRKGLTPEGRERLQRAALAHRPWEHATGPRTAVGKARSAANGKVRQKGLTSVRERRSGLRAIRLLCQAMQSMREVLAVVPSGPDRAR
jgi:hypothetical protein